jgi:hypothetical protein
MNDSSKVEESTEKKLPPNAGKGRQKGVPNKMTAEVKQMILDALEQAGGVGYLAEKAETHPQAFMALIGKVLPLQLSGEDGGPIPFQLIERKIVHPSN